MLRGAEATPLTFLFLRVVADFFAFGTLRRRAMVDDAPRSSAGLQPQPDPQVGMSDT
jgi:hypothetical protein